MTAEAWTAVALGEEAASYGYEVLIAQLSGAARTRGLDALKAHDAARNRARSKLAALGEDPSAPATYDLPFPVNSSASARRLAVVLELRLVSVYCELAEATAGPDRQYGATAAQESSTRAVGWGWVPTAFPDATRADTPTVRSSPGESGPAGTPAPTPTGGTSGDGARIQ